MEEELPVHVVGPKPLHMNISVTPHHTPSTFTLEIKTLKGLKLNNLFEVIHIERR